MSARKLGREEVKDIRLMAHQGRSFVEIARKHGVAHQTIGKVVKGKTYKEFNVLWEPMKRSKHYADRKPKLAPVQVRQIREEYKLVKDGPYFSELKFKKLMARRFKVSTQIIYNILKGYSYRGVK